jgi:hypothetical protein
MKGFGRQPKKLTLVFNQYKGIRLSLTAVFFGLLQYRTHTVTL